MPSIIRSGVKAWSRRVGSWTSCALRKSSSSMSCAKSSRAWAPDEGRAFGIELGHAPITCACLLNTLVTSSGCFHKRTNDLATCSATSDAILTIPIPGSATHADRFAHFRCTRRLRRSANFLRGQRTSIGLDQTRVPTDTPSPSKRTEERRLPGYVKDHVVPLACGGPDAPSNMQWQTVQDAKAKDR
jgi:hypothetical protein